MRDRECDRAPSPDVGERGAPSDHALIRRICNRDETALAGLYDRYAGLLFSLALRIVGDRELAQEVLQDTFLRCWDGVGQYDASRGRVASWLMGVTRNRAIDLLRSRLHQARLREHRPPSVASRLPSPEQPDVSEILSLRRVVAAALSELPPEQREAIELAYYKGMTQVEISWVQAEPLGTIKTRMRSALDRLRGALKPVIEAPGEIRD
jgi:RNA polymerase sigma-70 factor, ECF subfamily